jgi:signal transduction histidine kinase
MPVLRDLVSARTWLALTHHVAGLVVGLASLLVIVCGTAVGVATLPIALAGLPVLGLTIRFTDGLAAAERYRFAVLLGCGLPKWPPDPRGRFRWLVIPRRSTLAGSLTMRRAGYALLRLPASVLTACVAVAAWAFGIVVLALPLYSGLLPGGSASIGGTHLRGTTASVIEVALGLLVLLLAPPLTRGMAAFDAAFTRALLGPARNAELEARVSQLETSRERVVDAAEAERRRIERDLHDGAQQRLVALAMELGRAKAKFADDVDAARELVDNAHAEAKAALAELRDLVRGVHPPVLTDRGLDAALSGLAARCPVHVDVSVDVPVRPRAAVEAVAYFVVAEALTNVAKHSRASHASVLVEGHGFPGTLTVLITDDGIGGADPSGAGLNGLADRVSGVDGTLTVESPSGGPTLISAELPCG